MAHPGHNIGEDMEILEGIIALGVWGIEAYSNYHTLEQTLLFEREAKKRGILAACGSDFHGQIKPNIQLGSCCCHGREQEILSELKALRG